jgi:rhamnosyltransferase
MNNSTACVQVSVAILTKNPGLIFREVLSSVLNQELDYPYEILVIDSGSSDGTLEFLKSQSGVRLVEVPSSEFGHGKTRNLAMSLAQGRYVAMLTHDAKPTDIKWLSNLIEPLVSDASVAGVFGRHLAYPSARPWTRRDLEGHFNHFLQWPLVMGIEDKERYATDQGYRQVLHFFSDNNACLRKSVWEEIPYPDVDFAEDQLWAKSIIEAGYKRAYANNAVVFHSHDYSVRDTFRRSFDESRALKRLFGYDLCPSVAHACYQVYACTRRDFKYMKDSLERHNVYRLTLLSLILHVAKQFGFYAGRYQGSLKGLFFRLFSLDGANKRK